MKRYGNIYPKIYDIENLRLAHRNARKGKTWYREVKMVDADEDKFLYKLQESLINKTYKTSEYKIFKISDKGKEREISRLPYYPDRICQWAIMLQIEEIFLNNFIFDTYASIPNKGIHLALKRVTQALKNKEETQYCFKFDIKKYFHNINHDVLKAILRKKFKDNDLLWLLDEIIDSVDNGIPIGNYISQYFANFYLSYFDHWVKEDLGMQYYFRYMDDVVIFHSDKEVLHNIKNTIENYLKTELYLELKANWQVFPTFVRGVDFLGYRHFGDYVLLRKGISSRIKKKVKFINKKGIRDNDINSIMSYMGWLKHCNSHNYRKKYLYKLIRRLEQYEKSKLKCNPINV